MTLHVWKLFEAGEFSWQILATCPLISSMTSARFFLDGRVTYSTGRLFPKISIGRLIWLQWKVEIFWPSLEVFSDWFPRADDNAAIHPIDSTRHETNHAHIFLVFYCPLNEKDDEPLERRFLLDLRPAATPDCKTIYYDPHSDFGDPVVGWKQLSRDTQIEAKDAFGASRTKNKWPMSFYGPCKLIWIGDPLVWQQCRPVTFLDYVQNPKIYKTYKI